MPNAVPGPERRVRYHGYFYGSSGYAVEAVTAVRHLHELGYRLELVPRGRRSDRLRLLDPPTRLLLDTLAVPPERRAAPGPAPLPDPRPLDIPVDIHHVPAPLFRLDPAARVNIGRTMVETERLPAGWAEACRPLDEIWVPSAFNADAFIGAGLSPAKVRVVPIGVDTGLFRPRGRTRLPESLKVRRFRFLSVFAWQRRKGWDILVRAYLQEFKADEDVTLILKTQPWSDGASEIRSKLNHFIRASLGLSLARTPPVVLLLSHLPPWEMASLYNACDAFVLPSRGEGFGRPYLEAMASGLPAIGTKWSGNVDFMTPRNSYLIEVEGLEPASLAFPPDTGGYRWARPSVGHLRELMRHVYSHPEEARRRAAVARADVVSRWNARETCRLLARAVDRFL